jgi:Amino acid permease
MILAVTLNSIMQFAFMICLMFTIGDLDQVVNSPTLVPIIEVYYQATQSKHGTNFLVVMMAIVLFVSLFNIFASVSRLTWAFARDNGLPFSNWFSYVRAAGEEWVMGKFDKLNASLGSPNSPHSPELARLRRHSLLPPCSHLHRLDNRLQRIDLPAADLAIHFIRDTNHLPPRSKTPRATSSLRSLQARSLGNSHQHLFRALRLLRSQLHSLADHHACDSAQHELCGSAGAYCHRIGSGRLGFQRSF